jgi:hypothetical protein
MSFWIEIHCDVRSDGPRDPARLRPFCHTQAGNLMGMLASNGNIPKVVAMVRADALKAGWIKTRRGWECPACKTVTVRAGGPRS